MAYSTTYITTQGAILAAKTLQSKTLSFSKFAIGSGEIADESVDTIKALTELVNKELTFEITKINRDTDTQVTVSGLFKNTDAEKGFYLKELGLFAIDPDTQQEILFAYINYGSEAEYINNSITEKKEHYYDMIFTVDNANDVAITIDPNAVYVNEHEFNQMIPHKYNKTISTTSAAGTEIELPCYYEVGSNVIDVYLNGERLLLSSDTSGTDGHYQEVGNSGETSNKIKSTSDWNFEVGDVLDLEVRGEYNET